MAMLSVLILGKAFYIQRFQGNYWKSMSDSMHQRIVELDADRGTIYSEDGHSSKPARFPQCALQCRRPIAGHAHRRERSGQSASPAPARHGGRVPAGLQLDLGWRQKGWKMGKCSALRFRSLISTWILWLTD